MSQSLPSEPVPAVFQVRDRPTYRDDDHPACRTHSHTKAELALVLGFLQQLVQRCCGKPNGSRLPFMRSAL